MAQVACPPGNSPAGLVVARVGRVVETRDASLPWQVLDGTGLPIAPVSEFLRELVARGNTAASCRSYAYDLLRWFRFLAAVEVPWNRNQRTKVRDFVLWLHVSHNPARDRPREGAPAPGR
ncbi:site-specific integrase [Streptomyces sp. Ncost-T10-10d]|uniref:site-specific integrase n=1 Tax=Streptomyces sp. Ncost-T10-10d TaxID=1839774 RepID=UPI00081E0F4C|nr:site-specific integrase [Streptomyces sp. Ncost-T10-10d]SCF65391.1 Phage integrase, N-terminal SAM-like domain [Streptomyces sp. Ncost-T10-10d]